MGERVDLVDDYGEAQAIAVPIERVQPYLENGLHLQLAVVVIFNGVGEVLAQKRALGKFLDRYRMSHPYGIVPSDEDPETTAKRKVLKKTKIATEGLRLADIGMNKAGRYQRLYAGMADQAFASSHPSDFQAVADLRQQQANGQQKFVGHYFEDLETARSTLEAYKEPRGTNPADWPPAFYLKGIETFPSPNRARRP